MKHVVVVTAALLATHSSATAQEIRFRPSLPEDRFLSYMAASVAAGMYRGGLELNSDFIAGYISATGIQPILDPYYRSEFAKFEKQALQEKEGFCKVMRLMFYKSGNSKPLDAPLLIDKP